MVLPRYKDIVDLIKKGSTLEAQEQIMALRESALELQEENIELKEKIKELEKSVRLKGSTKFENGAYWIIDANQKDGPFCQQCFDSDGLLMRLHKAQFQRPSDNQWSRGGLCRKCGAKHEIEM
jgi:hypothetical protein